MKLKIKNIYLLILAAIHLTMPIAAHADDTNALQARYDVLKTAMAARDGQAVLALLTPDFQSVDISGATENGSQMMTEVAALKPDPNKVSQTTLISAKTEGDTAFVEQKYEMTTQKVGKDGQSHSVKLVTLSSDVWKKISGVWLMKSTTTKQMDYQVDGKPLFHKQSS